jgi:hypothetical protein
VERRIHDGLYEDGLAVAPVGARKLAQMWRQEILELLEAIHPRIDIGGVGFDEGPDVDCIADMSTRPELTTAVTSSQSA